MCPSKPATPIRSCVVPFTRPPLTVVGKGEETDPEPRGSTQGVKGKNKVSCFRLLPSTPVHLSPTRRRRPGVRTTTSESRTGVVGGGSGTTHPGSLLSYPLRSYPSPSQDLVLSLYPFPLPSVRPPSLVCLGDRQSPFLHLNYLTSYSPGLRSFRAGWMVGGGSKGSQSLPVRTVTGKCRQVVGDSTFQRHPPEVESST